MSITPLVYVQMYSDLIEIVNLSFGRESGEEIAPETRLNEIDGTGMDAIDLADILFRAKHKFGFQTKEGEETEQFIRELLAENPSFKIFADAIWNRIEENRKHAA